ncbi:MAG: hypothetical protein WCR06_03670 [bacterium]
MKRLLVFGAVVAACGAMTFAAEDAASLARGLKVDKYQVTGPVVEVTDTRIVIQRDDGKWQIARDAATKVSGEIKVGEKVTVEYKMIAVDIEVKATKAPAEKPVKDAGKPAKGEKK